MVGGERSVWGETINQGRHVGGGGGGCVGGEEGMWAVGGYGGGGVAVLVETINN